MLLSIAEKPCPSPPSHVAAITFRNTSIIIIIYKKIPEALQHQSRMELNNLGFGAGLQAGASPRLQVMVAFQLEKL